MDVIAHRGYWHVPKEKNTPLAFERALALGFGIETDVRDLNGALVVSHDTPREGALSIDAFVALWAMASSCDQRRRTLALNVKADGLQRLIAQALQAPGAPTDYFVFDMSIPDTLHHFTAGLPVYLRSSEFEQPSPTLLGRSSGVWVDAFESDELDIASLERWQQLGLSLCIVSPELHGRDPQRAWAQLRDWAGWRDGRVALCTDHPERAANYFC